MTDRLILRQGLERIEQPFSEAVVTRLIEVYLGHLEREVPLSERFVVFDGVEPLLDRCVAEPDYAVGLGTGNVARGAYVKLERANLGRYFPFGGFGCDAEDRTELIRTGAARGADRLGLPLDQCRVVVIGDTPRDVSAAHGIGATCLAVSTGGFADDALREAGADWVVDSLTSPIVQAALFLPEPD
jgi:phosphoglycolate phosphatase-like HAD superfamily hydrolase